MPFRRRHPPEGLVISTPTGATVERVIASPPGPIFDLLADADRHHDIDGSGSVVAANHGGGRRLGLGDTFGMDMKRGLLRYRMVSTIIELDEDRRIAWQTGPEPTRAGRFIGRFVGGRIWRYELSPVDGGTVVRESWDISREKLRWLVLPLRSRTIADMARTLQRIEAVVIR
jgi:hypothetical protein